MKSVDVPRQATYWRGNLVIRDLLLRASGPKRASWTDLPKDPSIYVVYLRTPDAAEFRETAGAAQHAKTIDPSCLRQKWDRLQRGSPTDIVYIGQGDDLRTRVPQLARFGAGRASNHSGGEWMWQILGIESAKLIVQACPWGKEEAFEGWLLDAFRADHRNWPLANRRGGTGTERWCPPET